MATMATCHSDVFADVIYRFANHLTSTTGGARGRDGMGVNKPLKYFGPAVDYFFVLCVCVCLSV